MVQYFRAGDPAATGIPVAAEPATMELAAGEPTVGVSAAGEPAAGEPAAGESVTGVSAAGEPAAGAFPPARSKTKPFSSKF